MVQPVSPCPGRVSPRWSVAGQTATPAKGRVGLGITLAAGLVAPGSRVCVGPPLPPRGPRSGFWFTRSVAAVNLQPVPVLSLVRLYPALSRLPADASQLCPLVLSATIVAPRVAV